MSCLRCTHLYPTHLPLEDGIAARPAFPFFFSLRPFYGPSTAHAAAHFLTFHKWPVSTTAKVFFCFVPFPASSGHIGHVELAVAVAHRQTAAFLRIGSSSRLRLTPAPHGNMKGTKLSGRLGPWITRSGALLTEYTTPVCYPKRTTQQNMAERNDGDGAHDELMRLTTISFLPMQFLALVSIFAGSRAKESRVICLQKDREARLSRACCGLVVTLVLSESNGTVMAE
ncbi:uncharacterized protein P884DRAFT_115175 [Thermothelomyces heterothallicus CBS 202.75]|uniref:uncharacterized protein n=1 Tax=Thermothelomyces heterothallicus CBS 202.75 TaxID=1149848 RepID=UPI003743DE4D